jgi:hypothetical protein
MTYRQDVLQASRGKTISLTHETQTESGLVLPPRPLGIIMIRAVHDAPSVGIPSGLVLPSEIEVSMFGQSSETSYDRTRNIIEDMSFSEPSLETFAIRSIAIAKQIIDSYGFVAVEGGLSTDISEQERIALEKICDTIGESVRTEKPPEDDRPLPGFYL